MGYLLKKITGQLTYFHLEKRFSQNKKIYLVPGTRYMLASLTGACSWGMSSTRSIFVFSGSMFIAGFEPVSPVPSSRSLSVERGWQEKIHGFKKTYQVRTVVSS